MKSIIQLMLCILCLSGMMQSVAKTKPQVTTSPYCSQASLAKNPHDILPCYLALPENTQPLWVIDQDEHDKRGLSVESYKLVSQQWPKPAMTKHTSMWTHRLIIYRPDVIKSHQALLFVNGGMATDYNDDDPAPAKIDFARIAISTQSVVVDLQDIPEQYLTMDNDLSLKEDGLMAYSWSEFLKSPAKQLYWPLQLPMTKSVIKAMDATQQIISQEADFQIKHFVLSGESKRGWAIWLAALSDDRVNGLVPIVNNVLNIKKVLDNTFATYNQWPRAFHFYEAEHIPEQLHTQNFTALTDVIDPMTYLKNDVYKRRMNIPKYIINASGDDFFTTDSLNLYLKDLPGENSVRITPNQNHAISNRIIENALLSYYEMIVYNIPRPHLRWKIDANGILQTLNVNAIPMGARLWEATNTQSPDFRFGGQLTFTSKKLTPVCKKNLCDYALDVTAPKKGYKADFVEVLYQFTNGDRLILTTPAYIISNGEKMAKAAPTTLVEKIKAPIALVKERFLNQLIGKTKMSNNDNHLDQLVDVIALSKKKCVRPIQAHLAYATKDNFVGQIIDGYTPGLTDVALMTKDAANALCEVQNDLVKHHGVGLMIYDSYRPREAVLHFVRWSKEPVPDNADGAHELARKKLHYPDIDKPSLFKLGYVSDNSQHSFGHTVDLVLIDKHGKELNHGTRFDFMGELSHYTATKEEIGAEAIKNRLTLTSTMEKHGFVRYPQEYWHFSYQNKAIQEPINIKITPNLKGLNVA
jgi:PhoPQ-activated pathogenicity-related protein/D-alanyl-D-alanine dipeptidase